MTKKIEVSVVLPCLNEEETIQACVRKAITTLKKHGISGEVVVSDNGSTDRSVEIAKKAGARVVHQTLRGYGNAYHKGFEEAKGKYMVMADADDTYDLTQIAEYIQPLRDGYDFVIGNRFKGNIEKGAMPWLHQYIGKPIFTFLIRTLFKTKLGDVHCGMRAFTREAYDGMNLHTTGMEYASEMVLRAMETNLKIKEIPTNLAVRGGGVPKLQSFRDGWRHLRFMLMHSPMWLYLIPGIIFFVAGVAIMAALATGPLVIGDMAFDVHPMFFGAALTILGYQVGLFGAFSKVYRAKILGVNGKLVDAISKHVTIDRGISTGVLLFLAGVAVEAFLFFRWADKALTSLVATRYGIIALVLIVIGFQTIFASFFLSTLQIQTRK